MSDAPETGTNKILKESYAVDTSEVDSVGGAKPEPEERPFFEQRTLEANAVQLADGEIFRGKSPTVEIQSTVEREMIAYGKSCGNCANFSWEIGQGEIQRIKTIDDRTDPDVKMLANLRAQLLETGVVDSMGDFVGHAAIFHDETAEYVSQMGACLWGTSHQAGEVQLLHPSQGACPQKFASGEDWEWSYKPKDEDVRKRDQLLFDHLMSVSMRRNAAIKGK